MLGQLRKPKSQQQEIGAVGVFGMNDGSISSQVQGRRLVARRRDKLNVLISDISRITISRHVVMSMKNLCSIGSPMEVEITFLNVALDVDTTRQAYVPQSHIFLRTSVCVCHVDS